MISTQKSRKNRMLIQNWKESYKYLTVQMAAALALLSQAYEYLPIMKEYIPQNYVTIISLLIIVARIVAQPKVVAKPSEEVK